MKPFTKWGIVGLAAVMILAAFPAMAGEGPTARPDQNQQLRVVDAYGKLPMSFEANRGQADPNVRFLARGSGYGLLLTGSGASFALAGPKGKRGALLQVSFVGARTVTPEGRDLLPGRVNYFVGGDSVRWRTDIPTFGRVCYSELYPGVDLVFYGNQRQLEFDFVVKPGADPSALAMKIAGAQSLEISPDGDLVIHTADGQLIQHRPLLYQEREGQRCTVSGSFRVIGKDALGFIVKSYDPTRPLVIDPVLDYSSYLGGTASDIAHGIAVDNSGHAYVVGETASNPFPTTAGAYQTTFGTGATDAFVSKFDTTASGGPSLVYSTYFGGTGDDVAWGVAVDTTGAAYVVGSMSNGSLPTVHPTQAYAGGVDAFLAKLTPAGNGLVYFTYLGGSGNDVARGIAVDSTGDAYVAGFTSSLNFPVVYPIQGAFQGGAFDAFVTKFHFDTTSSTLSLVYSTYLGGDGGDQASAIAVDSSGSAYVVGATASPATSVAFPTQNAFQSALLGTANGFLSKLTFSGSVLSLAYSTYLGGSNLDVASDVVVNSAGDAYVTGYTTSPNFPTKAPFQAALFGSEDAFVTKFSPSGSALVYSTFLGGSGVDIGYGIAVDTSGNAYVAGTTTSSADFPLADPITGNPTGGLEAFVTKLNAAGALMAYSTLLSGAADDSANAIAVDSTGVAYVAGQTASSPFPTTASAYQGAYGGAGDAFVSRLSVPPATCQLACQASVPAAGVAGFPVTLTGNVSPTGCTTVTYDWDFGDASPHGTTLSASHIYTAAGTYTWVFKATDAGGQYCTQSGVITIGTCSLTCSATVPATGTTGTAVAFTGTATPSAGCTNPVTYDWDFGDGSTHGTVQAPTHIYTAPGTFTWTLTTASGGIHCTQSGAITITGTACAITCSADVNPATGTAPMQVTFTATASGTSGCGATLTYDWNFGDGSTHGTTATATHVYVNPGSYTWTLKVTAGPQSCTQTGTVSVVGPLICSTSASLTAGTAPLSVNFTATVGGGYPPYAYAWDFGDGSTSTAQNPSHTYSQLTGGTYRAIFTVTDSQQQVCSDSHLVITVAPQCILTCSAVAQTAGTAGTAVAFAGSAALSNCPGSILYAWAFGDGSTSTSQYPTHVYAKAGTYTWTMTVSAAGLTCTRSGSIAIGVKPITLAWIKKMGSPFRIVVHGTNLQYGVQVYINGMQWGNITWKNTYKLILNGGNSLQTVVPMNVPTQFRFVNPDGSELTVIWQWP